LLANVQETDCQPAKEKRNTYIVPHSFGPTHTRPKAQLVVVVAYTYELNSKYASMQHHIPKKVSNVSSFKGSARHAKTTSSYVSSEFRESISAYIDIYIHKKCMQKSPIKKYVVFWKI
jgi:hypothetical protein